MAGRGTLRVGDLPFRDHRASPPSAFGFLRVRSALLALLQSGADVPRSSLDRPRFERLLAAGRHLVAELDAEAVLIRLLETARELTGARYAAIGVLDAERRGLERFLTSGVDAETT